MVSVNEERLLKSLKVATPMLECFDDDKKFLVVYGVVSFSWKVVVNNGIHHVLISPLMGHFKDKSLAFAFDSQNELASASENMIVWFPDSAQLTRPTHAFGK
ncbi:hypothetical protein DSO57_1039573 [Entomophthora muscae]|uniref:Uncharacterized protein n=1 Tax=Entomophthora muscae TaxID=34485 RepID=A0ACC2SYN8_9FUNG|nr:hypothetical protein DSO57_1039573 [Entomophthora muscae]